MRAVDAEHYVLEVKLLREEISSFNAYPFCLPAVRNLDVIKLHPAVTYIIGENGTGKSTLLEAIAVTAGFNPEGGTRNFNFATRTSHSDLHNYLRLVKGYRRPRDGFFLRAESFYNVATEIERLDSEPAPAPPVIDSYGGKSLHQQSHGESFMALVNNRFGGQGLYILDEPEAALSPSRQMGLLARLHGLVQEKSQFIIATHSPIIMAYPEATIFELSESGIEQVVYEETEHYRISRRFLNDRATMLKRLLQSEDC